MKSYISNKVLALCLLVVMVLNPLVAAAGSFVFEINNHDSTAPLQSYASIDSSQMGMAKCHESADTGSVISLEEQSTATQTNSNALSCCDDLCMCAQGGCHASLVMNFDADFSYSSSITSVSYAGSDYLNPVLNSLNPPPIA